MFRPKKTSRKTAPRKPAPRKTCTPKKTPARAGTAQQAATPRPPGVGCSWQTIAIVMGVIGFLALGAFGSKDKARQTLAAATAQPTARAALVDSARQVAEQPTQATSTERPTRTPYPTKTPRPTSTDTPPTLARPTAPPAPTRQIVVATNTPALAQRLVVVATNTSVAAQPVIVVATSTPAPDGSIEPTAAPTRGTDANPVFTQDGDQHHVDPAWWPCKQGQTKGNNNSMIYHTPQGTFYDRTWDDVTCFNTSQEAAAAGFRASKR